MRKIIETILVASLLLISVAVRPASAAPLDDASLKAMITNLGYTTTETAANGVTTHWISATLADNSYTVQIYFQLSSDKINLWVIASLFAVPKGKTVPNDALLGMLIENDTIAPKSFSIGKANSTIYLNSMLPNNGVTPVQLRQTVDSLTNILGQTESYWVPEKWAATAH